MVSIAPNAFRITGEIISKKKHSSLDNFITLHIRLAKVEHLHGPENFLDTAEKEIDVSMNEKLSDSLKKGMHIQGEIRKAPGQFFVIPDSISTVKDQE
jgi:hypothetical protein